MSEISSFLIPILKDYGYVLVFIGTIIAGETVILAAAFLAFLGFFNIFIVIAISVVGTIISDNLWYLIGLKGHKFIDRWMERLCIPQGGHNFIQKHFNNHYGKFLIMSKFIYGTRTAALVVSGHQKVNYRKFLLFNLFSIGIWIIVIIVLGYLIGFSWSRLEQYTSYAHYWILGLLALLVVIRLLFNRLIKYNNESGNRGN